MENKNLIRLGIIGCGGMSGNHRSAFEKLADICTVSATCDIIKERAQAVADAVGAEFVCTDYHEMIGHVDAVLVVLPHHLHYDCGMFFAEHGVHVLMEKPLCNTEEECLSLIRTCEEKNVKLMCAYPVRYWLGVQKLKELLDSGKYGRVMQFSIWTEQWTDCEAFPWAKSAKLLGGGQLFSHGCHYIDILLWFLGKPVSGAHFGSNVGTPWMEKEGTSNVVMNFENGAMAYHFATWGARGSQHGYTFQVFTDKGFFEYNHGNATLLFKCNSHPDPDMTPIETWNFLDHSKQTQYEIRHFLECIREDKRPLTDGWESLQSLRVIWKLYEAEENGTLADLRGLGLPERND